MGSRPGSPFGLEDKASWTSWKFNFGGFTVFPYAEKHETRGLETIQATFFGGYFFSFKKILRQREIC